MNRVGKSIIQQLFVFALSLVVAIAIVLKTSVIERLAYSVEKGRIRALRDSVPTAVEMAHRNAPSRTVAAIVAPTVVAVICERSFDLSDHPWLSQRRGPSGERDADSNGVSYSDDGPETNADPEINENPGTSGPAEPNDSIHRLMPKDRRLSVPAGYGSGFIVDAERGYILTNNHVIDGADSITVQLADSRRFEATVLGTDSKSDLAVIRIEADDLHDLPLADNDDVEVGDEVMAVGNPFGLSGTFSRGIISGKGRSSVNIHGTEYRSFLQTDAVINPGNSGGPLVNMRGEVVGINTAIATESGHYDGVGFAIPSKRIRQVLPALIAGQVVPRGYLGIVIVAAEMDEETSRRLGWNEHHGVIVREVLPDTPADRHDLRPNDIVIEIDGQRLRNTADLIDIIGDTDPEESVDLLIWRNKEQMSLPVTVARQPRGFSTRVRRLLPRNE